MTFVRRGRRRPEPPIEPEFWMPCGHGTVPILLADGHRVYSVVCPVCSSDYNLRHVEVVRSDGQIGHAFRPLNDPR